jgi:chloramphenicol-sensitive protein RarD
MITSAHLAAIIAFSMWGLFPIYWKYFQEVAAWDLFAHRLIWSFVTLIIILIFKKKLNLLKSIWQNTKVRWMLITSAVMISSNWLLYIYSVHVGKVLEASLGYFLNPLINVFLGWIILKEKIRPMQWPAILLAILSLALIGFQSSSEFPWLALTLSLTFALYGLIRKVAHVGSLEGLAFETSIMIIPTILAWIFFVPSSPFTVFQTLPLSKVSVLMTSGIITCAPLILFAYSAKRLPFMTLGFIQYLSPSLKFVCGWLIFEESLSPERLQAFSLIWVALVWYTVESIFQAGKKRIIPS